MTLWLIAGYGSSGWKEKRYNISLLPCPTLMAAGVAGSNNSSQYFIEEDGHMTVKKVSRKELFEKPPYRIPSMVEIAAVKPNGLTVVSTFTGAGGSCLGFRMAGFTSLWACEFIPSALEVYELNHPGVPIDPRDIRKIDPVQILKQIGKKKGQVDVLEGSPPCASFSTAGKRSKLWGEVKQYSETKQRTDDLFWEFARILKGIMPKVFIAENVTGLVKGVSKGYFKEIFSELAGVGYNLQVKVLDAQWLGVPQRRQRVIFMGVRNDLKRQPVFPKPLPYRYSVADALPYVKRISGVKYSKKPGDGRHTFQDADKVPAPTVKQTMGANTEWSSEALIEAMKGQAIEGQFDAVAQGQVSKKYMNFTKPHPDEPSPTVTQMGGQVGMASVVHPIERRKFTIPELRRICGFPDDFILTGTYQQQWERLGRAVPPPMMKAVAESIRDHVLKRGG